MLLRQKQIEAILSLGGNINEKELRKHYLSVFNICFDKMVERKDESGYGTDEDLLKSIKEMDISDLGSLIKTKGIRIKNTDDIDSIKDSVIDAINYSCEILRRLQ